MKTRRTLVALAVAVAAGALVLAPLTAAAQDISGTATPAADSLATQLAEQVGTVTGQIINGTLAAGAPAGLDVVLHSFDAHGTATASSITLTTTTTAEGFFTFEEVVFSASRQFVVAAAYGGATYTSGLLAFAPGEGVLDATVQVYESTADPSGLRLDKVHTFLEFASAEAVTVGQLFAFSNAGSAAFGAAGEGRLHFYLPPGATAVSVQDAVEGQNLFATEGGFDLALPVAPGEGTAQVLVSFSLPYAGAVDFAQTMAYPVASANVLITDLGVSVSDSSLAPLGVQAAMGMQFQGFEQANLPAGEALKFRLSGAPTLGGEPAAPAAERPWGLIAALGGLGAGLVAAGGWLFFRRGASRPAAGRDELLQALAELDERHEANQVSQAAYERARDRLKQQLREQWS